MRGVTGIAHVSIRAFGQQHVASREDAKDIGQQGATSSEPNKQNKPKVDGEKKKDLSHRPSMGLHVWKMFLYVAWSLGVINHCDMSTPVPPPSDANGLPGTAPPPPPPPPAAAAGAPNAPPAECFCAYAADSSDRSDGNCASKAGTSVPSTLSMSLIFARSSLANLLKSWSATCCWNLACWKR